jgi:hypothetical protein
MIDVVILIGIYVGLPFGIRAAYLNIKGREGKPSTKKWIWGVGLSIVVLTLLGQVARAQTNQRAIEEYRQDRAATSAVTEARENVESFIPDVGDTPATETSEQDENVAFNVRLLVSTFPSLPEEDQTFFCEEFAKDPVLTATSVAAGFEEAFPEATFTIAEATEAMEIVCEPAV